jgi:hypothetical protein
MAILPNMLLLASASVNAETAYWNDDDGSGDLFIGLAYRWRMTLQVQPQIHSSPASQTPFQFDGNDVEVDDWIANGVGGRANQIVEIISKNSSTVVCIVEDVERYNIFSDPTMSGAGSIEAGNCIVFKVGDDGLPLLGPVPDFYLGYNAVNDLEARFLAMNSDEFVLVRQVSHGMVLGDLIYADPVNLGGYLKTDSANIANAVGIVVRINIPGLDYFSYRPLGSLITKVSPPLTGVHGTIFYADPINPGKLTSVEPVTNPRPIYMRLDRPDRAILIGRPADTTNGSSAETYKYNVGEVATNQELFTLPSDCHEVLFMSINGIENENFTFNETSKELTFDPIATGYGVDGGDEVFFIYKS